MEKEKDTKFFKSAYFFAVKNVSNCYYNPVWNCLIHCVDASHRKPYGPGQCAALHMRWEN